MADVACDELKVVIEGRGCDLQISVGKDVPASLQIGADLSEDASGRDIVREGGYGRKNALLDVLQVAFLGGRAVRALEEFTDGHRARELLVTGNRLEPIQIGSKRTGAE